MTLVIGLTGGIGSGKSLAGELFAAKGVAVIDTDAIAHQLTAPGGAAIRAIADAFGATSLTAEGALDRPAMRARVFADPAARQRLEAILHPLIRDEVGRRLEATRGAPYQMLMVPLLVETGAYRDRIQRIVVVDCAEATQIERVMRRSGLARDEVARILAAQASREQRLNVADDILENDGDIDALRLQAEALHTKYLAYAKRLG